MSHVIKGLKNLKETPFSLDGVHTEVSFEVSDPKDMHLMATGQACTNCTIVLPSVPKPGNLNDFVGWFDRWPIPNEVMRVRVMDGACPVCGMFIDPETITRQIIDNRPKKADERPYEGLPSDE